MYPQDLQHLRSRTRRRRLCSTRLPKYWNCDFKLHAPKNTTIEGCVVNGELKDLVVTPDARRADVRKMTR